MINVLTAKSMILVSIWHPILEPAYLVYRNVLKENSESAPSVCLVGSLSTSIPLTGGSSSSRWISGCSTLIIDLFSNLQIILHCKPHKNTKKKYSGTYNIVVFYFEL